MESDHDRLDGIFKNFRESKNKHVEGKKFFKEFKIGLQRHIVWEEDILFKIFENHTGMHESGPTEVMRMEHRQIKEFLEKIHNNIRDEKSGFEVLERGLLDILTEHNNKEETILYPEINDMLSEEEQKKTIEEMKKLSPERYEKCC